MVCVAFKSFLLSEHIVKEALFKFLFAGVVKKGARGVGIVHEFNKIADKSVEECRSALSGVMEKTPVQVITILTPLAILDILKRMPDEVLYLCHLQNVYWL